MSVEVNIQYMAFFRQNPDIEETFIRSAFNYWPKDRAFKGVFVHREAAHEKAYAYFDLAIEANTSRLGEIKAAVLLSSLKQWHVDWLISHGAVNPENTALLEQARWDGKWKDT
jgi:hypothetical protein